MSPTSLNATKNPDGAIVILCDLEFNITSIVYDQQVPTELLNTFQSKENTSFLDLLPDYKREYFTYAVKKDKKNPLFFGLVTLQDGKDVFIEIHKINYHLSINIFHVASREELKYMTFERASIKEQLANKIQNITSKELGISFFNRLCLELNKEIGADYTFVGQTIARKNNNDSYKINTISLAYHNEIIPNFSYDLQGTPCRDVLNLDPCFFEKGITNIYPDDQLLIDMEIEGYVGIPIADRMGNILGILVSLFKQPIENIYVIKWIFHLFAPRIGAELERELFNTKLQKQQETLELALNAAKMGIWDFDPKLKKIHCSLKAFEIFRISAEDFNDTFYDFIQLVYKEDRDLVENTILNAIKERTEFFQLEHRLDNNPNEWVEEKVKIYFDNNRIPMRITGTVTNITDRKKYEEDIQKHNNELQKTNKELDKFVYSVSHDLRAPIASSLGLINIAKFEDNIDQVKEYLTLQEKTLTKLDSFIRDILDYSRNARLEITPTLVNFNTIFHDIFQLHSSIENYERITKTINIENETSIPFKTDEKRLYIIFNNLLSNALRFIDIQKAQPSINISVSVNTKNAEIEIKDNGIGIQKEHIEKIFNMFHRATDVKTGSGLGLYIVKEALEKLNGEINVTSIYGSGTTFLVKIPNLV